VIQVKEGSDDNVNLRIPLGLAAFATRFIPRGARVQLDRFNIDLGQLVQSIALGQAGGNLIDVREGDSHVRIAIETDVPRLALGVLQHQ
jgi:hypothetical protein